MAKANDNTKNKYLNGSAQNLMLLDPDEIKTKQKH